MTVHCWRLAVRNPHTHSIRYFGVNSLPFGASRSVGAFLRKSLAIWWTGLHLFRLAWTAYFDTLPLLAEIRCFKIPRGQFSKLHLPKVLRVWGPLALSTSKCALRSWCANLCPLFRQKGLHTLLYKAAFGDLPNISRARICFLLTLWLLLIIYLLPVFNLIAGVFKWEVWPINFSWSHELEGNVYFYWNSKNISNLSRLPSFLK